MSQSISALKNVLGGLLNQAKDLFGGIQLPNISLPQIPNFPKVNLPSIDLSPITDTFGKVAEAAAGIFPSQPKFSGKGGLGIAIPGWAIPPSYGTPGPSGPLRYFAGGGGGGGNGTGGAAPDAGGGGVGSNDANAGDATANTGGGGGSAAGNGELTGGDGGSGIVICRYNT